MNMIKLILAQLVHQADKNRKCEVVDYGIKLSHSIIPKKFLEKFPKWDEHLAAEKKIYI